MSLPAARANVAFWAAVAAVLAAAAWLHAPALRAAFFADDYLFLDQVRDRSLWTALQAPDPLSNFLRPLSRQVWFWCVAGLTNESPFAFRIGNLGWVLLAIAALAGLVRRVAGERAALLAAAVFALHYSADVAVRWASGSQDAMAVALALVALWAFVAARPAWACVALLAALFCKEIVAFAPLIAIALGRRPREPWRAAARRAWPLGAAVAAYVLVSVLVPRSRQAAEYEVQLDVVQGPLAALAHLPQVALGLEWVRGAAPHVAMPPWGPLAIAGLALWAAWRAWPRPLAPAAAPVRAGLAWALLATAPIAAVAHLWSAYYYLFAIAGLALALGAALGRRTIAWALAVLWALAWGSAIGRDVPGYTAPRDRWSTTSHVNREHIERANRVSGGYLASLLRQHPDPAPRTTFFFAGVQGGVAFQRADGPLLRWAYRDTSVRGWFHSQFTRERYARGPAVFMVTHGDTLADMPPGDDLLLRLAFGMAMSDALPAASEALQAHLAGHPADDHWRWWLAWVALANRDTATANATFARLGVAGAAAPAAERERVLHTLQQGDTLAALRIASAAMSAHPLDPGAVGLLADLLLMREPASVDGAMLALAARALAPADPYAWRRWGLVQFQRERLLEALRSLEHYAELSGGAPGDADAHRWMDVLRARLGRMAELTVGG